MELILPRSTDKPKGIIFGRLRLVRRF